MHVHVYKLMRRHYLLLCMKTLSCTLIHLSKQLSAHRSHLLYLRLCPFFKQSVYFCRACIWLVYSLCKSTVFGCVCLCVRSRHRCERKIHGCRFDSRSPCVCMQDVCVCVVCQWDVLSACWWHGAWLGECHASRLPLPFLLPCLY